MKSLRFSLLVLPMLMMVCFISCSSPKETRHDGKKCSIEDHVEVLYFHGNMRCLTCRAIEKFARETVDSLFHDEVKSGKVIFREVSIPENEALSDSYQTTGSSLFVTSFVNGNEIRKDMTEYGFKTARKQHKLFQDSLSSIIRQSLKEISL